MLPISLARATPDAEVLAALKSAISESESPATDLAGVQDLLLSLPELSDKLVAKFDEALKAESWGAAVDAAQALAESAGRTLTLDDEGVDEASMLPRNYDRAIRMGSALYAKKYRVGPGLNATAPERAAYRSAIRAQAKRHAERLVPAANNASYSQFPTRDIARAHTGHWFSPATKRFFRSRVSDWAHTGPGGVFFVSSEKPPHGPRHYSVRHYQDPSPGGIKTAGKFGAHTTSTEAHRWAAKYAKGTHLPPTLESGDDLTAHLITEARAAAEKILPVLDTQQPFIASLLTQFDEAANKEDLATVIETSRKLFAAAEEADTTALDGIEEAAVAEMADIEELTTSGTVGGFASAPLGYDDATADDATDDEDAEQGEDTDDDDAEAEHLLRMGGIGGAGNGGMDPNDSTRDPETDESAGEAKHPLPNATSWPSAYGGRGKEFLAKHGTYQVVPNSYTRTRQGVRKPAKALRARFISHAAGSEWQDLGHADSLTAATRHARSHFDSALGASTGGGGIRGESTLPKILLTLADSDLHREIAHQVAEWASRNVPETDVTQFLAESGLRDEALDESLTRKHFKGLADIVKQHKGKLTDEQHKSLATHLAAWAAGHNPDFDRSRFMSACGRPTNEAIEGATGSGLDESSDSLKHHAREIFATAFAAAQHRLNGNMVRAQALDRKLEDRYAAAKRAGHSEDDLYPHEEAGRQAASTDETYVSRDPFARTELHKEVYAKKGSRPEKTCDWCGTSSNDRTLYSYRTESDGGRKHEHKGKFCGRGCHKSHHNESVLSGIQADLDEAAGLIEAGAIELPVEVTGANSGLQFTIEADGRIVDADPQILEAINDPEDDDDDDLGEGSMPGTNWYDKKRYTKDGLRIGNPYTKYKGSWADTEAKRREAAKGRDVAKSAGSANVKEDTGQGTTDPVLRFVDLDLGDTFSFVDAANSPRLAGAWVKTSYRSYRDATNPNDTIRRTPAVQVPVVRVGGDGDVRGLNNPGAGNGLPDGYDGGEGADIGEDVEEGFTPLTDEASQLPRGKRFRGARRAAAKDALAARNRNPKTAPRQKFAQNQYVRRTVIRNKGRDPQAHDHPLLRAARSAYKSIHQGVNSLMRHRDGVSRKVGKLKGWSNAGQVGLLAAESVNGGLGDNAHELVIHADSDRTLYHGSFMPIVSNLSKRVSKGDYDHEKAKKLWGYHADRAAQSYHKQFGSPGSKWHHVFSPADRKEAAAHWADREYEHIKNGKYRHEAKEGDDYADPVEERGGFKRLVRKLEGEGKFADQAAGIAAKVGREKFGARKFAAMAAAGRHAHEGDESADDLDGQVDEASRSHQYRGSWIHPAQSADKRRQGYHWYIEKAHSSGVPYGHESSPHHRTLGDAKAAIDDQHKDRAPYESASTVTFAESKMDEFSALAKAAGVSDDATVTLDRDAKTVTVTLTAEQVEALDGKLPTSGYAVAAL